MGPWCPAEGGPGSGWGPGEAAGGSGPARAVAVVPHGLRRRPPWGACSPLPGPAAWKAAEQPSLRTPPPSPPLSVRRRAALAPVPPPPRHSPRRVRARGSAAVVGFFPPPVAGRDRRQRGVESGFERGEPYAVPALRAVGPEGGGGGGSASCFGFRLPGFVRALNFGVLSPDPPHPLPWATSGLRLE